jgi:hypothetical protein
MILAALISGVVIGAALTYLYFRNLLDWEIRRGRYFPSGKDEK